jgi:hypothetical protein
MDLTTRSISCSCFTNKSSVFVHYQLNCLTGVKRVKGQKLRLQH